MRERRKSTRLKSQDKARLEKESKPEEGQLLNISLGGMCILLDNDIKVGSPVSGEFKIIPGSSGTFYVHGEVVWVKPAEDKKTRRSFEVGIKFYKVSTVSF